MSVSRTIERIEHIQPTLIWFKDMITRGMQSGAVVITLGRPLRTLAQNKKMWPMLNDIATQITWYDRVLSKKDWKDLLTSAWKQGDSVPGINGGVVFFGVRTSKLSKPDFSELIELIYAFGSGKGVKWSEKAEELYQSVKSN